MGNEEKRNTVILIRLVMSLYEGAKTKVIMDFELPEELKVKLGMRQRRSVLSPFSHAVVVDVVTELARESMLSQLL